MITRSNDCSRKSVNVQNGEGLIDIKQLATQEDMYGHVRMFSQCTVHPGCSIGVHPHEGETEFYYILKGEPVFIENGVETILHPGDVTATTNGDTHGIVNRSDTDVELIALIPVK